MPIVCLILIIINLILLGILYWLHRTTIYETYTNIGDDEHMRNQKSTIEYLKLQEKKSLIDRIQINAYDPKAVLLIEVVVNCKAFEPTAVLFEFVFATNVLLPIATFCEPDTLFCKAF